MKRISVPDEVTKSITGWSSPAWKSEMIVAKDAKPVVSFVVPVFNSEQYVARCLQSIKSQDIVTGKQIGRAHV